MTFPGITNIYFDTKMKFLRNLVAEIWTFKNSLVSDGGHFEYCSIKKKKKKKKCSIGPRWHQADFSLIGCTLPENEKKTPTKHPLCPKMRLS